MPLAYAIAPSTLNSIYGDHLISEVYIWLSATFGAPYVVISHFLRSITQRPQSSTLETVWGNQLLWRSICGDQPLL